MPSALKRFLQSGSASGVLLLIATVLALIFANSGLKSWYDALLDTPVEVRVGALQIAKPLLLWINDGLMAVFFFLVGLELKREMLVGSLSSARRIVLPAMGALGGMLIPALIYAALNRHDPIALNGWAIPAATDIAFALGILALLGSRVPPALRVFLATLAVVDDIGAIIIIAIFYTDHLSAISMAVAGAMILALFILNRLKVAAVAPYLLVGLVMWVAVLKSGVHATLAGVVLALFIPYRVKGESGRPLSVEMEHSIERTVAFGIMPLFAFANAGVSLNGIHWHNLLDGIPLGIAAGLFFGKQLGVFLFAGATILVGAAKLPEGATWRHLYGISLICGIGFTMSLFISSLAFDPNASGYASTDRLGILLGSFLSAVLGLLWLRYIAPKPVSTK
ncbi:Na+/H+ antiporter NhaA [Mangrovitalea sediminis]|uniref:Na+/H+ antiporter NhaA n=1 Tax=Mangrovitalea sediminis TaxID=1982043 RepID=UPI000BE4E566|nr:Na+/H+ antiporter NhaA [Mangrovitalea sediminis]